MSLFKIQLENGEFYKSSKGGRVQHYRSTEKAAAKIKKLGEIAAGATVVESKARTSAIKTVNPEENATDNKVEKVSKKKSATKAEKNDETESDEKVASCNPEEIAPDNKVEKVSKKKSGAKAKKTEEGATNAKIAGGKTKKAKKAAPSND